MVSELPLEWNTISDENIFLSIEYLRVLEKSTPSNMQCHYIGVFLNNKLVGISISQFLNLNLLKSFGERDHFLKTSIRNFVFKNYCSHVLLIGNNMLSGQNSFAITDAISETEMFHVLQLAVEDLKIIFKKQNTKIHITAYKDFGLKTSQKLSPLFKDYYLFSIQPNMTFTIANTWETDADYVAALSKKYRDQHKRARKKCNDVEKRKLSFEEIKKHEVKINELYQHVAKNSSFNTFFLAENHFSVFKEELGDQFLFYGYFIDNTLIGFNTLIKNGKVMDTYFLGYDASVQREKMLYLNMLYDMVSYSIKKKFKEIVFARTALEIKSSVGAQPIEMYGYIKHSSLLLDLFMGTIFRFLEPRVDWNRRNPFK